MNLRKDHYHTPFQKMEIKGRVQGGRKFPFFPPLSPFSFLSRVQYFCGIQFVAFLSLPERKRTNCNQPFLFLFWNKQKPISLTHVKKKNNWNQHFQQRMSWLPQRWRTQRNAIRHANCKIRESSKFWTQLAPPLEGGMSVGVSVHPHDVFLRKYIRVSLVMRVTWLRWNQH